MSKLLDEKILEALLNAPSVAAAARDAGCTRDSIYARLKDPAFVERLNAEIACRREANRAMSQQTVSAACEALRAVLNNPLGAANHDILRACEIAFRYLRD